MLSRRTARPLELECLPVSHLATGLRHSMGHPVPTEVRFTGSLRRVLCVSARLRLCMSIYEMCYRGCTRLTLLLSGFIAFFITFFGARILLPVRTRHHICNMNIGAVIALGPSQEGGLYLGVPLPAERPKAGNPGAEVGASAVLDFCCVVDRGHQVTHSTTAAYDCLSSLSALMRAVVYGRRYHGPRPTPRADAVWVCNHTSMIDYIILTAYSPFAVIMQLHPGWVRLAFTVQKACQTC